MKIKVGVIVDHVIYRHGFCLLLSSLKNVELSFSCGKGFRMLQQHILGQVELVFVDCHDLTSMELSQIFRANTQCRYVLIGEPLACYSLAYFVKPELVGYLHKGYGLLELQTLINRVLYQRTYGHKQELHTELNPILIGSKGSKESVLLSSKEIEIVRLFMNQLTAKQIAALLHISVRTVEKHKETIMRKTQSFNFIGAIIYALVHRYIQYEDLKTK